MEMRFIFLTLLIASLTVYQYPLHVDSTPPIPATPSTPSQASPPAARSQSDGETNGRSSTPAPPSPPTLKKKHYTHHAGGRTERAGRRKINLGKKIGLLFVGVAGVLQIAVVVFLGFKRWQISNMKESASDSQA